MHYRYSNLGDKAYVQDVSAIPNTFNFTNKLSKKLRSIMNQLFKEEAISERMTSLYIETIAFPLKRLAQHDHIAQII